MDALRPETLVARDACVFKAGLLGRRGQLALYGDAVVFATASDSLTWRLSLEAVDHLRLLGRRQRLLAIGSGRGDAIFKLDQANARFGDLCAILVQLHPPLPWLDARFGTVDQAAAAAMIAPHGLALEDDECLELCEWSLSWEGEDLVRCGWLLLTNRRVLFLHAGEGAGRPAPIALRLDQLQRCEPRRNGESHLVLAVEEARLRFAPHGGSEFIRAFWDRCRRAIQPMDRDAVRRGQALTQLTGPARISRLHLQGGPQLSLRDLAWMAEGQRLRASARFREVEHLPAGAPCAVELIMRGGLFVFEGRIEAVTPVDDGPFKPSQAWLALTPTSDIQFVNRRRAFRVEINRPLHVHVARRDPEGGWEEPISTVFRLADLSSIGCALVGPAEIPLDARFAFDLPLGPEERRLRLVGECVHARPTQVPPGRRIYGLQLQGLSEHDHDALQREVVCQERMQLRRRALVR